MTDGINDPNHPLHHMQGTRTDYVRYIMESPERRESLLQGVSAVWLPRLLIRAGLLTAAEVDEEHGKSLLFTEHPEIAMNVAALHYASHGADDLLDTYLETVVGEDGHDGIN